MYCNVNFRSGAYIQDSYLSEAVCLVKEMQYMNWGAKGFFFLFQTGVCGASTKVKLPNNPLEQQIMPGNYKGSHCGSPVATCNPQYLRLQM